MTESSSDRLRAARERAGFKSAAAFAAKHGLTESTYRSADNGNRSLTVTNAKAWAPLLGVTWQWLMEGEGPMPSLPQPGASEPAQMPRFDLMPRNVPVYGSAACASGEEGEFEFNTGDVIDFVKRPPRLEGVKEAYALYLTGTSMVPWRKEGALVYVHPGLPPQIEGHVVLQLKPGREGEAPHAMVKQLLKVTAKDILLHQYNPARDRPFPRARVVSVHRVLEWDELLGI